MTILNLLHPIDPNESFKKVKKKKIALIVGSIHALFVYVFLARKSFVWMELPVTIALQLSQIPLIPFPSSTD